MLDLVNALRKSRGRVFISYAREDKHAVDRVQRVLQAADIHVWRDTSDLRPGQDWRSIIRDAIVSDSLAFVACFSTNSIEKGKCYQNEEIGIAIEELKLRRSTDTWLIPARLDDCKIPEWEVSAGRTLSSLQHVDLFGDHDYEGFAQLIGVVSRALNGERDPGDWTLSDQTSRTIDACGDPDNSETHSTIEDLAEPRREPVIPLPPDIGDKKRSRETARSRRQARGRKPGSLFSIIIVGATIAASVSGYWFGELRASPSGKRITGHSPSVTERHGFIPASKDAPSTSRSAPPQQASTCHKLGNLAGAPPRCACVDASICRYLRIAVLQEYDVDGWAPTTATSADLVANSAGSLRAINGARIVTLNDHLRFADTRPCQDVNKWTSSIAIPSPGRVVCLLTAAGDVAILIRVKLPPFRHFLQFLTGVTAEEG